MNIEGHKVSQPVWNMSLPIVANIFKEEKRKVQSLEEIKATGSTWHSCLSTLAVSLGTWKLYNYNKWYCYTGNMKLWNARRLLEILW